jgi:hypothetical protein
VGRKHFFPLCWHTAAVAMRSQRQFLSNSVNQGEWLKPNLIVRKIMTRKPSPVQGVLTFLNPLFGCASFIIELDNIARFSPKIHDY